MTQFDLSLYLVLDPDLCRSTGMVETAKLAAAGGVTMVQLRDKTADTRIMIQTGLALKEALRASGIPLIINDDVEAAIAIQADGVHVGQDDAAIQEVRRRIPPDMILGLSVETVELAQRVDPSVVDYVGVGPVFATATKPDHKPPIGFDGLAAIVAAAPVPAVAIGGLNATHVGSVMETGAKGLAVVSAICGAVDPSASARRLSLEIEKWRA